MDMSVFLKLQQRVRTLEKEKKQLQDLMEKNEDNNRNIASTTADALQVTNNQVNNNNNNKNYASMLPHAHACSIIRFNIFCKF